VNLCKDDDGLSLSVVFQLPYTYIHCIVACPMCNLVLQFVVISSLANLHTTNFTSIC